MYGWSLNGAEDGQGIGTYLVKIKMNMGGKAD